MGTNNCQALVPIKWATEEDLKTINGIIYCIVNIKNGRRYVGYSTRNFYLRYNKATFPKKVNGFFKMDIKKFGLENFKITILESGIKSEEALLTMESYYEKLYKSLIPNGYNVIPCGVKILKKPKKIYFFKNIYTGEIKRTESLDKFGRENKCNPTLLGLVDKKVYKKCGEWILPDTKMEELNKSTCFSVREISTWRIIESRSLKKLSETIKMYPQIVWKIVNNKKPFCNNYCNVDLDKDYLIKNNYQGRNPYINEYLGYAFIYSLKTKRRAKIKMVNS